MKRLLPCLGAILLLTSCSTPLLPPPPGVARLHAEPPSRRWESYDPYVKIKAVDGRETSNERHVDLKPGFHHIMVTAHRDAASNGMSWGLGVVGSMIGSAIDTATSAGHLTTLNLDAEAGAMYVARLYDDGFRYFFWIETWPGGQVVSGEKPPGMSRTRQPR